MEIDIRRADIKDAALLSVLSTNTFLETFTGTCTDDDIQGFVKHFFNREQVFEELQDDSDFYFIAYMNNGAIGYLRMKEEDSNVPVIKKYKGIELKRIYVLKDFFGRSAGAALMKFALALAAEKNYEAVW